MSSPGCFTGVEVTSAGAIGGGACSDGGRRTGGVDGTRGYRRPRGDHDLSPAVPALRLALGCGSSGDVAVRAHPCGQDYVTEGVVSETHGQPPTLIMSESRAVTTSDKRSHL